MQSVGTGNNEMISRFKKRTNKLLKMQTVCKYCTVVVYIIYICIVDN